VENISSELLSFEFRLEFETLRHENGIGLEKGLG
jgi:hypothetical protein